MKRSKNQAKNPPNEEGIKMLLEGKTGDWNKFREDNPDWKPYLAGANLEGVRLYSGTESLWDADSPGAIVAFWERANLEGANLEGANLKGANLKGANLNNANLKNAKLSGASLHQSSLKNAILYQAGLENTDLEGADLRNADLRFANLDKAIGDHISFNQKARYRGIKIATSFVSPRFRRFAQDQDFIEEFRSSFLRYPIYIIWLILADCGRSFLRWALWSVVVVLWFGFKFASLGPDAFDIKHGPLSVETMVYYSVVTFTTLGFGDITPITLGAKRWVMTEVIIGYIMLGGLISIFATKLAKRS